MELVLRAAPFFLLPLLLQRWFLELGRRRHRLHFLRWVLPVLSLVLLGLAWQGWHANQIFGAENFAGGMARKRQADIAGLNAGAVVHHAKV